MSSVFPGDPGVDLPVGDFGDERQLLQVCAAPPEISNFHSVWIWLGYFTVGFHYPLLCRSLCLSDGLICKVENQSVKPLNCPQSTARANPEHFILLSNQTVEGSRDQASSRRPRHLGRSRRVRHETADTTSASTSEG
jgi:hypothetical protein